jgi:hypothetical protein
VPLDRGWAIAYEVLELTGVANESVGT